MNKIYIYSGHSKIGNPSIITSNINKTEIENMDITKLQSLLEQYLYTYIPEGLRLITLYKTDQTTNMNTTELVHRAIKNIGSEKFSEYINILFDYSDQIKKVENICNFKKLLVSNFLIYSLNKNSKSKLYDIKFFNQMLYPMLSINTIQNIWNAYAKTISNNACKVWSKSYLISLFKFDFIDEHLIDIILNETKINLQIYKPGDKAKYMQFDDLVFFKSHDSYQICYSGLYPLESYYTFNSIIWKVISKQNFKQTNVDNLSEEKYFLKEAFGSRSIINVTNKFERIYSLDTIFSKIGQGTFIIPSCGVINKSFVEFIEKLEIDKKTLGY